MALPRTYDPIFRKYGQGIPVNYLRALAKRESNMDPNETKGPAWGLLQVIELVRNSYNKRHRTSYSRYDLLDPSINVMIATDTMRRILASYKKTGIPALQENWHAPSWVLLFTKGWNDGYSNVHPGGGVGCVAKYLVSRGIPVTHDNIYANVDAAGCARYLKNPASHKWQKTVTALFYEEGGPEPDVFGAILKVGLVAGVTYGAYKLMEK